MGAVCGDQPMSLFPMQITHNLLDVHADGILCNAAQHSITGGASIHGRPAFLSIPFVCRGRKHPTTLLPRREDGRQDLSFMVQSKRGARPSHQTREDVAVDPFRDQLAVV